MQHNICLAIFAFLLSTVVSAQSSTIILNQKISAKVSGVNKSYQIQAANQPATQFEITIQNGDGLNYFPQVCSGNLVQRVLCAAENLVKAVYVEIDRPEQLEVKINNVLVANRSNFPQQQGQLTVTRTLANVQNLTVFAKGLPTSSVTIKVKKFSSTPNQLPIARFDFNTANDVEPSVVSFSALLSSDADGSIVSYNWNFGDSSTGSGAVVSHTYNTAGSYNVSLTVTDDRGGQHTLTKAVVIRPDTYGPQLSNILPANNSTINGTSLTISGDSDEKLSKVEIKVNNEATQLANIDGTQKHFSLPLNFANRGAKNILITAYDLKNNQTQVTQHYNVSFNNAPTAKIIILSQSDTTVPSMIWFSAEQSTDPDGDQLTYSWDFSDVETSTEEKPTHLFKEAGTYTVTLTVNDGYGGSHQITKNVTLQAPVLPDDPAEHAPPLSQEAPQSNGEQLSFLVEGPDAVQKDAVLTSFDEDRATAINGKVLKNATSGLEAVKVTIKDHPEYGYTLTREDGKWDLLVNGGGELIVQYEKDGYLGSTRIVNTENQAATLIEDVILVEADSKKTVVSLGEQVAQVHESTVVTDNDGARRTQVVIPANTTAQVVLPNGSTQTIDQLTIRATELSVGADGAKKLPAELPSKTAYTYAADFSADEAVALGAQSIEFSRPVPMYVDNFLNVPVGYAVPIGYLNPKTGYWEPSDDGVVLKVLSIVNEKAQLDFKGEGQVISAQDLTMLGIDDAELKIIASKFQAGQSFWRAQSRHFSTYHWGFPPTSPQLDNFPKTEPEFTENDGVIRDGPVINVQRQMLEQSIPAGGLDFDFDYTNEKAKGRNVANSVEFVPVNSSIVTPSPTSLLSYFKVTVNVVGQKYEQDYAGNVPHDTVFNYSWDGKDAFGREVPDAKEAVVTTDYRYPANYEIFKYEPNTKTFDTRNPSVTGVNIPSRGEVALVNTQKIKLSSPFDRARVAPAQQFGGWMPSILKSYDPVTKHFTEAHLLECRLVVHQVQVVVLYKHVLQ